jgi:hypothetical protein
MENVYNFVNIYTFKMLSDPLHCLCTGILFGNTIPALSVPAAPILMIRIEYTSSFFQFEIAWHMFRRKGLEYDLFSINLQHVFI